jgi:hypothetical protein
MAHLIPTISMRVFVRSILLGVVASLLGACSILTERQVDAVARFAKATDGFPQSPVAVSGAHADARRDRGLLEAAAARTPEAAITKLRAVATTRQALRKVSAEIETSTSVLSDYADLLTVLSSDEFTAELQNQAVALGNSIDGGVSTFNQLTGRDLESPGAVVAGIVRAGGGLVIRRMQQKALERAVIGGEEAIHGITTEVECLMAVYLTEEQLPPGGGCKTAQGLFLMEEESVEVVYPRLDRSLATAERAEAAILKSQAGVELAQSTIQAARGYREAHAKLKQAIEDDSGIEGLIAQIDALATEVKAGNAVRKQLKED